MSIFLILNYKKATTTPEFQKLAENGEKLIYIAGGFMIEYQKEINTILKKQRCLYDDVCFAAAASERPEIIEDIVMRVFSKAGIPVMKVTRSEIQKKIFSPAFKDIVFDCYAETEDGVRMAVEVQNDASGFGHEREGFYLSKLRLMEDKGKGYDEMMPVYLIILHRHNPYRKYNLPIYRKSCYIENTDIRYADGMNVLRVNGDYMERGDVLGDLMRAMKAERAEETELELYSTALEDLKEEIDMKYTFRDLMEKSWSDGEAKGKAEGIREGEIRGEARGEAKAKNEIQEALRKLGVTEDIISKAVGSTSI